MGFLIIISLVCVIFSSATVNCDSSLDFTHKDVDGDSLSSADREASVFESSSERDGGINNRWYSLVDNPAYLNRNRFILKQFTSPSLFKRADNGIMLDVGDFVMHGSHSLGGGGGGGGSQLSKGDSQSKSYLLKNPLRVGGMMRNSG